MAPGDSMGDANGLIGAGADIVESLTMPDGGVTAKSATGPNAVIGAVGEPFSCVKMNTATAVKTTTAIMGANAFMCWSHSLR